MPDFDIYEFKNNFDVYKDVPSKLVVNKNKKDSPFFTVFMPTYKRASTFETAFGSVLDQKDFDDFEILVINNLEENEENSIREIMEKTESDRLRYYVNEKNIGMCGNWNRGVELAKGKYIVMLHDDDILSPYALSSVKKMIEKTGMPGVVTLDYVTFDSRHMPVFEKPEKLKYNEVTKEMLFFDYPVKIAGVAFKRETALKIGGFADELYPNEDAIFMYQNLLLGEKYISIRHVLAGYRIEVNASLTGDTLKKTILYTEQTRRSIAKHEKFAQKWMKLFDDTFLYLYIKGANKYWKTNVDYREILRMAGFEKDTVNGVKLFVMKVLLRLRMLCDIQKE